MKRFRKLIGRFISTEKHMERLTGSNESALEALYFIQERRGLQDGILRNANLDGADWTHATLATARLEGINLQKATLRYIYLFEAHLEKACLNGADLTHANLRSVFMQDADANGANFTLANLARARLDSVNLQNAVLADANLWCAILSGADMTGASLQRANVYGIVCDETTRLPDGTLWTADSDLTRFV